MGRAPGDRIRHAAHLTTPVDSQAGVGFWNRAFMQSPDSRGPVAVVIRSLHLRWRLQLPHRDGRGDTSATGITLWASPSWATASGTLSLEDPKGHNRAATVDAAQRLSGHCRGDRRHRLRRSDGNAQWLPCPTSSPTCASIRLGLAGISGALHDASGAYYGAANNVVNGHPADSWHGRWRQS